MQPPGFVHKIIHDTWLPLAVPTTLTGSDTLSVSAQISEDRTQLRLLVTNNQSTPVIASIAINGWVSARRAKDISNVVLNITSLSAKTLNADNPPSDPTRVSPTTRTVGTNNHGGAWTTKGCNNYSFPPLSVGALVLTITANQ